MKNKIFKPIFLLFSTLIFLSFIGCPGAKRDELEYYRSQVDSLRNVISNFIVEYNQLKFDSYQQNEPFLLSNIYKKYKDLFSQQDINLINKLLKLEQRPERIDRLERLKVFIYEKIVEKETAYLTDQIEILKNEIAINTRKGKINFDNLHDYFALEPNRTIRKNIYNANQKELKYLQKLNLRLLSERKRIIIDSLNFNSYLQFASMLRQEDIKKFYLFVQDFLNTTNDFYFQQLYEILRNQRYPQENLYHCDLYYLARDQRYEKYFKADSLKNIFLRTFYNLNIPIDSLPNLKISFEEKLKRKEYSNKRTAGHTINIPEQNYLNIIYEGSCSNYSKTFYEIGKLLPEIFSQQEFFEFKYFGGNILPLTFGHHLINFFDEENFLLKNIFNTSKVSTGYWKQRAFNKLFNVRKLCADFLVEYLFIDSIQTNPDSLVLYYNTILGYNLTSGDKARLFHSLNDYFSEIENLNSIFISAMLKTRIREKYGNEWFNNPDLKDYWLNFLTKGRKLNKEKFLIEIGYYNLDPRFFFNEVISLNEKSKTVR